MNTTDQVIQVGEAITGLFLFGVWFLGFRWYWRKRIGVIARLSWAGKFAKSLYFLSFIPFAWLLTLFYVVIGAMTAPLVFAVFALLLGR